MITNLRWYNLFDWVRMLAGKLCSVCPCVAIFPEKKCSITSILTTVHFWTLITLKKKKKKHTHNLKDLSSQMQVMGIFIFYIVVVNCYACVHILLKHKKKKIDLENEKEVDQIPFL